MCSLNILHPMTQSTDQFKATSVESRIDTLDSMLYTSSHKSRYANVMGIILSADITFNCYLINCVI